MSDRLAPNRFAGLLYNALVKLHRYRGTRLWKSLWNGLQARWPGPVRTVVHGHKVVVNAGYTYPVFARTFPAYNNPLLELVARTYEAKGNGLTVIDVGAAIGDTALLVRANCPGMVERFVCIDGDEEFVGFLKANLAAFKDVTILQELLSDAVQDERETVRTHAGTASALGPGRVRAETIDNVVARLDLGAVDVLKTDVDGFDGKVLRGAADTLRRFRPSVIFEWHPTHLRNTGNDPLDPFHLLGECGYPLFLWFDKFGEFSHFSEFGTGEALGRMAEFCRETRTRYDWHYDVIAVHPDRAISPVQLADLGKARGKCSPY